MSSLFRVTSYQAFHLESGHSKKCWQSRAMSHWIEWADFQHPKCWKSAIPEASCRIDRFAFKELSAHTVANKSNVVLFIFLTFYAFLARMLLCICSGFRTETKLRLNRREEIGFNE